MPGKSVLVLLVIVGLIFAVSLVQALFGPSSLPASPKPAAEPQPLFENAADARRFILSRLRLPRQLQSCDCGPHQEPEVLQEYPSEVGVAESTEYHSAPYSLTYLRIQRSIDGARKRFYLNHGPRRELALARAFAAHGFIREAVSHYRTLNGLYPATPEGRASRAELPGIRSAGVASRFEPGAIIYRDASGRHLARGRSVEASLLERAAGQPELFSDALVRIHQPLLRRVDAPVEPVVPVAALPDIGARLRGVTRR